MRKNYTYIYTYTHTEAWWWLLNKTMSQVRLTFGVNVEGFWLVVVHQYAVQLHEYSLDPGDNAMWLFCKLGVLFVGILITRSRLFGVHIWGPDLLKLPCRSSESGGRT